MPIGHWLRSSRLWTIVTLVVLPLACGIVFLVDSAPRDWSLHWVPPRTLIGSTTGGLYDVAQTPRGWDVLWTDKRGHLRLSRFDRNGTRITRDVPLKGAAIGSVALGRAALSDVAVWRQDFNGGSQLRAAIVSPSGNTLYRLLATGTAPLEHPRVFALGSQAGIVFSWQRPVFDVYLDRIGASGKAAGVVRLTHVHSYAYEPRAIVDASGAIQLVYFDENSTQDACYLVAARYSRTGRLLAPPRHLDSVKSILGSGTSSGSVPADWGLDVRREGLATWVAYSGDGGVTLAQIVRGRMTANTVIVPVPPPPFLSLALAGNQRALVWPQNFDLGTDLATVQLNAQGIPPAAPDRVAFESATDAMPTAVMVDGRPTVLWQATPKQNVTQLEMSHFSPAAIGAPNLWSRLGLGLANPLGNLALLMFGSMAFGLLITIGNVLLVLLLTAGYVLLLRMIDARVKWYVYLGVLAVALYLLLVQLGAPFPPVFFFSGFSVTLGLVAMGGMIVFVLLLTRLTLRRLDEGYRAAAMAFTAFYFLAFLQALTIIQGQLGKI